MPKKSILSTLIIAGLCVALAAMFVVASENPAGRAEYLVPRITCGACAQTITGGLDKLPGVTAVEVDVANTLVRVGFDDQRTDAGEIALALTKIGYPGRIVALNGKAAPGADAVQKRAGGCGGNCCKPAGN